MLVVLVVKEEVAVLVTNFFVRYSYSNEFVVILVSKVGIHFQLVVEAIIKRK